MREEIWTTSANQRTASKRQPYVREMKPLVATAVFLNRFYMLREGTHAPVWFSLLLLAVCSHCGMDRKAGGFCAFLQNPIRDANPSDCPACRLGAHQNLVRAGAESSIIIVKDQEDGT